MDAMIGQLQVVRPVQRARPNRLSLENLNQFLDAVPTLAKEPPTIAATPSPPTPKTDNKWMEECGLVAAAARHKARREAKEAKERYMLEVVDIGRAFPPASSTAASSVETSARTTPFASPHPAATPTRDPHHPMIKSTPPSFFPTPSATLPSPATPSHSCKSGGDKSSSDDSSPARVSQKAFVRLMGYNTKSTAALQSLRRTKWWSSTLETPRHSSTSMPVRSPSPPFVLFLERGEP